VHKSFGKQHRKWDNINIEITRYRTAGYTWTDYKTNLHIAKELEITPVLDELVE
jgi:hypothetical protein